MEIRMLTDGLSVSPQILASDMQAIRDAGFRTIICNRPDGEGSDQPTFEEVAKAAKDLGIRAVHQPIVAGQLSDDDVTAFEKALTEVPGPVLAFCRTGTRSATLWALGQASHRSLPDILAITGAAGYDMRGLAQRIADGTCGRVVRMSKGDH